MACVCSNGCAPGTGCQKFTTPARAARAGRRLSKLWDKARDMYSRAGLRPYQVCIIRARASSAGRRGDGPMEIVHEWPILPTPKIGDLTGISEMLDADQLRESGNVTLSEISLSYTEDFLLGRGTDGTPIPAGEIVFWEIRQLDIHGKITQRRRFVASSPPMDDPANAEWTINLVRAHGDRDRRAGVLR